MAIKRIYTWSEVVRILTLKDVALEQKDLSSLIVYARQQRIGKPISYQKTDYNEDDLKKLRTLIRWWSFLNRISIPEWRDKKSSRLIQKIVIKSLVQKEPLLVYAVYCPSYKKGAGAFGYTGTFGKHTKSYIKKFSDFVLDSEKIGIKIEAIAYFSDLLLENYENLIGTSYKKDLQDNFKSFKRAFQTTSGNKIEARLLSTIEEFRKEIGEPGIQEGPLSIPADVYDIVLKRNEVFYLGELGWTREMVKKRTDVLSRCYARLGLGFRKMYPEGIMFWVESAYERGRMYHGLNQDNPIPIIYPVKDE